MYVLFLLIILNVDTINPKGAALEQKTRYNTIEDCEKVAKVARTALLNKYKNNPNTYILTVCEEDGKYPT